MSISLLTGPWLYRALLKQARALPDDRAVNHYVTRIRKSFRAPVPSDRTRAFGRTKDAQKLLRQLIAANEGHLHAIDRVLLHAYDRRGKRSQELLEPFISSSKQTKSFSSPSLRALLTSPLSHTSRPPTQAHLDRIPTLPPRAFKETEESRLMGPLIPQRIQAIQARYWNSQIGKIIVPVAVHVRTKPEGGQEQEEDVLEAAGLERLGGVQEGVKRLERMEQMTQVDESRRPLPPRRVQSDEQRRRAKVGVQMTPIRGVESKSQAWAKDRTTVIKNVHAPKWGTPKIVRPRLLRRRYEGMLEKAPIVVVGEVNVKKGGDGMTSQAKVSVRLSEFAKGGTKRVGRMSEEDLWWVEKDKMNEEGDQKRKEKKGR